MKKEIRGEAEGRGRERERKGQEEKKRRGRKTGIPLSRLESAPVRWFRGQRTR